MREVAYICSKSITLQLCTRKHSFMHKNDFILSFKKHVIPLTDKIYKNSLDRKMLF